MSKFYVIPLVIPAKLLAFYKLMLLFYPKNYRKRFEYEMVDTFCQMYLDEIAEKGKIGVGFWLRQLGDIFTSVTQQHIADMQKKGPKKYMKETLHVTHYSLIGFILVLPFLLVFSLDMVVVLFTGNRNAMQPLYHSVFWTLPILPIWLLGFPLIAILLNLIPLFQSIRKTKLPVLSLGFAIQNAAAGIILAIGCGAVILVFGHDVIPCTVTALLKTGVLTIIHILQVCKNA